MSVDYESQVFIDGKSQIIEMLRLMPQREKSKLIRNLRLKNPALADELLEEGLSFEEMAHLDEGKMHTLLDHISPSVLGVALRGMGEDFQRHILSTVNRRCAEEAYVAMIGPGITEEKIARAQKKVLRVMSQLS